MIYLYVYLACAFLFFCFAIAYSMEMEELSVGEILILTFLWPIVLTVWLFSLAIRKFLY